MEKPKSAPARKTEPEASKAPENPPRELGGPPGPEPTRHGDWEFNGRCTDF